MPALLPESARQSFEARARDNRLARLPESERKKVEEAEEWRREAMATGQGLALMENSRARGFVPGTPTDKQLITHYEAGRPPETYETERPGAGWQERGGDLDLS